MRSSSRYVRGVGTVIQILLVIIAVVAIVSGVMYYMMRDVVTQAESQKPSLAVTSVQAYYLGPNSIAVTVWVENVGTDTVTISNIYAKVGGGSSSCTLSAALSVQLQPGQSMPVSAVLSSSSSSSSSSSCTIQSGEGVYVYVSSNVGNVGSATVIEQSSS